MVVVVLVFVLIVVVVVAFVEVEFSVDVVVSTYLELVSQPGFTNTFFGAFDYLEPA